MFIKFRFAILLAAMLALSLIMPVFAGGWAVITLDELPSNVLAGKPLTIGFTVLQHGRTPMTDLHPTITADLHKGDKFVVTAEPEGKSGHYTATLTFPKEGDWSWSIQAFTMDQTMPVLRVAPASASSATAKAKPMNPLVSPLMITSIFIVGLGLVGAVFAYRRKSRPVGVLTALCLLVGAILAITGAGRVSAVEAQGKLSTPQQVEWGQQLFLAKGCITCHSNSKAADSSEYLTIQMGAPDLSKFSASPEVLRMRLHDPTSVKSDTGMPKLTLSDTEIEALIAFINSK